MILDMAAGTEAAGDSNTVAQHLLLDFLADCHQQKDAALAASACSFLTCRLFADELTGLRPAGASAGEQQLQLLRRYQTLAEQLGKGLKCSMDAGKWLTGKLLCECSPGFQMCLVEKLASRTLADSKRQLVASTWLSTQAAVG